MQCVRTADPQIQANAETMTGLDETLPGAAPRSQMLIEEGAPVAQTLSGVRPVGSGTAFRAQVAANRAVASAESAAAFVESRSPTWQEWFQTMQATRQYRESLGAVEVMFEHSRAQKRLSIGLHLCFIYCVWGGV